MLEVVELRASMRGDNGNIKRCQQVRQVGLVLYYGDMVLW